MIWKDVPGYEGLYLVSSEGHLVSFTRGLLRPAADEDGYPRATLTRDGEARSVRVHRIVAEAFIPNPDGKPTVNHINEVKTDNRAVNLEWATMAEQNAHGTRMERVRANHAGGREKIPVLMLDRLGRPVQAWGSVCEAASAMSVHKSSISKCLRGRQKTAGGFLWRYAHES